MTKHICPECHKEKELTKEFWYGKETYLKKLNKTIYMPQKIRCRFCQNQKNKNERKNRTEEQKHNEKIKKKAYNKKYKNIWATDYKNKVLKNICIRCGKSIERSGDNVTLRCIDCSCKCISKENLGNFKRYGEIKKLFEEQKGLCFYSGRKLIFGKNASLDHVIPKNKGGTNNIENLRWADLSINRAKSDMSYNEFLKLIEDIYYYSISKKWNK